MNGWRPHLAATSPHCIMHGALPSRPVGKWRDDEGVERRQRTHMAGEGEGGVLKRAPSVQQYQGGRGEVWAIRVCVEYVATLSPTLPPSTCCGMPHLHLNKQHHHTPQLYSAPTSHVGHASHLVCEFRQARCVPLCWLALATLGVGGTLSPLRHVVFPITCCCMCGTSPRHHTTCNSAPAFHTNELWSSGMKSLHT